MKITGHWTWSELAEQIDKSFEMLPLSPAPIVDAIVDMREALGIPLESMSNLRRTLMRRTDKSGYSVIVSDSMMFEVLISTFARIYPPIARSVGSARTMEEAAERIEKERARRNRPQP